MTYDPDRHHRRSIRLKGYDYLRAGAYFITLCVRSQLRLFGHIDRERMTLNDAGRMIGNVWESIPRYYPGIDIDAFVIMPDHVHGIVILGDIVETASSVRAAPRGRPSDPATDDGSPFASPLPGGGHPRGDAPTEDGTSSPDLVRAAPRGRPSGPATPEPDTPLALGDIVLRFKTLTTHHYIDGVMSSGWQRFDRRLWHRGYYEHIVRNASDLDTIRRYIVDNPARWGIERASPMERHSRR